MTLITSISGIRGTIGGKAGEGLTPTDIVRFTGAYGAWLLRQSENPIVVVGRDARPSGEMVKNLVTGTLVSLGISVLDLDYATTPTVEMAVTGRKASGGIIITASHNPENWNALKLLNGEGQFLRPAEAEEVFHLSERSAINYAEVASLGSIEKSGDWLDYHIDKIIELELVKPESIRKQSFRILVDTVNSVGALSIPPLLEKLGVGECTLLNGTMDGHFAHNPEPLPENLHELSAKVVEGKYDLGIAVDPDVDRLAFVCEDGSSFGEEYTLVSIADYWLANHPGNTVSNLSSTRALRDITLKHGGNYFASAVGEINVVEKMIETGSVIGGEGNGGVIIPQLHYGRDALAGIALFLSQLAVSDKRASEIRKQYPDYHMSKNKIQLDESVNVDEILKEFQKLNENGDIDLADGVKIDFEESWVHLRKSNTEPIVRIYAEAKTRELASQLALQTVDQIRKIIKVKG